MNREQIERNIARNIALLRKRSGMTQAGLAERIGYSDKSVSKWERGDGIPDVVCLKQMADLFGVTLDTLLAEEGAEIIPADAKPQTEEKPATAYVVNHRAIVLITVGGIWLLAALAYIIILLSGGESLLSFVIALPVTALLLVIFNAVWGTRCFGFFAVSGLIWSILFCVCWICRGYNLWLLMILGVPATFIVWLSGRVRKPVKPASEEESTDA